MDGNWFEPMSQQKQTTDCRAPLFHLITHRDDSAALGLGKHPCRLQRFTSHTDSKAWHSYCQRQHKDKIRPQRTQKSKLIRWVDQLINLNYPHLNICQIFCVHFKRLVHIRGTQTNWKHFCRLLLIRQKKKVLLYSDVLQGTWSCWNIQVWIAGWNNAHAARGSITALKKNTSLGERRLILSLAQNYVSNLCPTTFFQHFIKTNNACKSQKKLMKEHKAKVVLPPLLITMLTISSHSDYMQNNFLLLQTSSVKRPSFYFVCLKKQILHIIIAEHNNLLHYQILHWWALISTQPGSLL